jgi:hypothetical protein
LLPRRLDNGAERREWIAARVDEVDERELHLRTARVVGATEPELGTMKLTFGTFDQLSRDERASQMSAGRFLEIGKYLKKDRAKKGSKKQVVLQVRVHPASAWDGRDLPPLFPDPARYART